MEKTAKIFVAGHKGLVGSAITRQLKHQGYTNLILRDRYSLDLTNQCAVQDFFASEKPDYIFLAAAKVGGIYANDTFRGEFIYNNLAIQTNIIESARRHHVKRLMFLGSSCIYPRQCPQPMQEQHLLTDSLEPTSEAYAIAKIAGIKMCESYNKQYGTDFISVIPANLYGPNDNFDLKNSHVLPALMRKFHEAKMAAESSILVWGSGNPTRDFLHVDDLAEACLFIMNKKDQKDMLNIGSSRETSIRELTDIIKKVIAFPGKIVFDKSKPDGTLKKVLDSSKLNQLGWHPKISLEEGIQQMYQWLLEHQSANEKG